MSLVQRYFFEPVLHRVHESSSCTPGVRRAGTRCGAHCGWSVQAVARRLHSSALSRPRALRDLIWERHMGGAPTYSYIYNT